ncbi:MAG: hypothetical protein G01um101430_492 [Parcubacteria group bacterium Gr01-1014_30]|nr:MAG: hypothetical protein G01um101430_492 [Parcubacteria group bacterium Gr01-1014_30]
MNKLNMKQKILMIEDDHFLRKVYRDKLIREGFDFIEATNGIEGTNKIISEKPDLVLLDLILPKKNGFDVLIDVKRNKETANIPVIILSNLGQESDVKRGLSLGAKDYLIKPEVGLSQVIAKVKEWLVRK